jgi:hypothetical protein
MSDRPAGSPVPPLARASTRKRANTDDGMNDETTTERCTRAVTRHYRLTLSFHAGRC